MKKKHVFCLVLLLLPWTSYADSKPPRNLFFHLDTGLSSGRNMKDVDNSGIFGAGLKYQVTPKVKIGTNFTYRPGYNYEKFHNVPNTNYGINTKQTFKMASLMVNATYDIITIGDKLTPYAEIGVGVSHIKLKKSIDVSKINRLGKSRMYKTIKHISTTYCKKTFNQFTISAGVGLVYKINNNMDIDLNYKLHNFGKITDEFMFGLRFKM